MKTDKNKKNRFPWRAGNDIDLLVDGECFFPAMLSAILSARKSIFMEMYLFESGRVATEFIDALNAAAKRGVRVYLLLDALGAYKVSTSDRKRLVEAGVHLYFYNPLYYGALRRNLWRDHRKLLLVDGDVAFVGGAGICDEFSVHNDLPWHDIMISVRGPCLSDWQQVFQDNWNQWGKPRIALEPLPLMPVNPGVDGRVVVHERHRPEIKRSLIKRTRNAEQRVWIATAYFLPSWKQRRALRHAARNGADVRLLLPGPITDHPAVRHASRRYYGKLLAAGVRIFEYQPRFLHAKAQLCDRWVSIGSCNLDRWNFSWNLEANQEVQDHAFVNRVVRLFEDDFSQSVEYHSHQWGRRSWHRRLLERFWGRVEQWLTRLSQRRGQGPKA